MKIIKNIREMQALSEQVKRKGKTISLVPTMGYLHEGHLSLVKEARKETDIVIVSIFVNPTQFGPNEDLKKYPRNLKRDMDLLSRFQVDAIFYPDATAMYPPGYKTYVKVNELSDKLCGKTRPIHFQGVATVLLKLFNIIRPDIVYLGRKDFQQQVIVRKMAGDLNLPIKIIALPIIRETDGIAMSSRNTYLNGKQRNDASVLYRALQFAKIMVRSGERDPLRIKTSMRKMISKRISLKIDYISICDPEIFEEVRKIKDRTLITIAAYVGKTRLIDNLIINPKQKK